MSISNPLLFFSAANIRNLQLFAPSKLAQLIVKNAMKNQNRVVWSRARYFPGQSNLDFKIGNNFLKGVLERDGFSVRQTKRTLIVSWD